MHINNYLIVVFQKDIPLHRDFNIYTKVYEQNIQHKTYVPLAAH